jgi:Transposase DDE domain
MACRFNNNNHHLRNGLPVSVCAESATPHEVTLAMSILLQMAIPDAPQNLIGDNAYDCDRLDAELRLYGIELIAPHRRNRKNSTQDGRRLKRYRRRWKIERLFAWLHRNANRKPPYSCSPEVSAACLHLLLPPRPADPRILPTCLHAMVIAAKSHVCAVAVAHLQRMVLGNPPCKGASQSRTCLSGGEVLYSAQARHSTPPEISI